MEQVRVKRRSLKIIRHLTGKLVERFEAWLKADNPPKNLRGTSDKWLDEIFYFDENNQPHLLGPNK
jgi:hypothetical protein